MSTFPKDQFFPILNYVMKPSQFFFISKKVDRKIGRTQGHEKLRCESAMKVSLNSSEIDAGRKGNDVHGNHLQRWLVAGTISLPKCSPVFENTATGWLPHQSLPLKYGSVEYLRIQKSATWSGIERNRPHLELHNCEASIISCGFSIVVAHRCVRILTTWVYSIANHCDSLTTHCTVQVLRKSRKWSWIFVPLKCNDQVGLFCKPYSRCVACCPEPVSQSSLPWVVNVGLYWLRYDCNLNKKMDQIPLETLDTQFIHEMRSSSPQILGP